MLNHRAGAIASALITLVLGCTQTASAQSSPLQLGVGYQFVHESVNGDGQSFPLGVYAAVEGRIAADQQKAWSWIGQFEAAFRRDSGFSEQLFTELGGIRLASAKPFRWVPSGFGLIGIATLNASCDIFCAGTDSGLALQGGFAMTTHLSDSMLFDATFKATKLKLGGGGIFDVRVGAGVRWNIGR